MNELYIQIGIGLFIIVVGILNFKGNISILHSYHRKRVKQEDIIPFGKTIGLGTIIIGVTTIIAAISELFLFNPFSDLILALGFVPGIGIAIYGLLKYNKGIF